MSKVKREMGVGTKWGLIIIYCRRLKFGVGYRINRYGKEELINFKDG